MEPRNRFQESIPAAYVAWRAAGTLNRVVVPARQAGNRFLGSLKGLQLRALVSGLCTALNFLMYIEPNLRVIN
jgi:hypothetical protein